MTGASQALDRVGLTRGHLELENEALGKKTVYDDLAALFRQGSGCGDDPRLGARPGGTLVGRRDGGWRRRPRGVPEPRAISVSTTCCSCTRSHPPFDADMPISFKIDARLAANSAIQALQGRFALGAGYFKLDDPDHEPFLVDEATGEIAWDAAARRYRFSNLQLLSGATHIFAAGWLAPPTQAQAAWLSHFESDDTVFAPERPARSRSSSIRPCSMRAFCRRNRDSCSIGWRSTDRM